jgi:RimJ/RimL family protein N-acetyltransferase
VAKLIDNGSTLQLGLGAVPGTTLQALSDKKDLGIHTEILTDGILALAARGVVTNRKKGFNNGKMVAGAAMGTSALYEFIHDNPQVEFYPSDYINNPGTISRHNKMVSLNVAMAVDLTGQVAADALPYDHYSGVSGMADFIRGAADSLGGKSILMLSSTSRDGKNSHIVASLGGLPVVVPRAEVQYVATEFGVVNLFGKSLQERATALISIAHPDFREGLFSQAKESGLLGPEKGPVESISGIYPIRMEEVVEVGGQPVFFRPSKPVDERMIQEHFYNLDPDDVVSRFLREKLSFPRKEMTDMVQLDYIRQLTFVAVLGEPGFEQVIGLGGYFLNPSRNTAEVAFSVLKAWQKKGVATIILKKLYEAARNLDISGFYAFTRPQNLGMIRLFGKLPGRIERDLVEDVLLLKGRFDQTL